MARSRRTASRGLVVLLTLTIGISSVCVLRKVMHSRTSDAAPPPALPVLNVTTPAPIPIVTPTTKPAVLVTTPPSPAAWGNLLDNGSTTAVESKPSPLVTGSGAISDGRNRMGAGELIDARTELNDALQSGHLSDADATAARTLLMQINQTVVFSPKPFAGDPYAVAYSVRQGDSLARIAFAHDSTWQLLARINHLDPRRLRYGTTIKVVHGPFFAVVRKGAYTLDAYLGALPGKPGSMYVMSFPVGLGRDDSTPTGLWAIAPHAKLKHPTYYPPEGGPQIDADDPKNPLGGYWIALTGIEGQAVGRTSYGIHGTIEPDSIGHQSSMGCIRLRNDDIALVFDLMVEGKSLVRVEL